MKLTSLNNRRRIILLAALFSILFFSIYVFYLRWVIVERIEGKTWSLPSKVYSAPFGLYPGQSVAGSKLFSRLDRLGYHRVSRDAAAKGEYAMNSGGVAVYLHDFPYPDDPFKGFALQIDTQGGTITGMKNGQNGEAVFYQEIEPELIAGFFENNWEERTLRKLKDFPPALVRAVVSIEDERFYTHHGVDPRGIARAVLRNLRSSEIVQGGSTLTQQLVKNFFLDQKRTYTRKFNEIIMALLVESRYYKEEILEAYLNEIYWGQKGEVGIFGAGKAAQFYFEKDVKDLTLAESALLAGLIRAPNHLDPHRNFKKAIDRKNVVLKKMLELHHIRPEEYRQALFEKIVIREASEGGHSAPFFADLVRQQLLANYPKAVLNSEGLNIFTTLDVEVQKMADETVRRNLEALEKNYPRLKRDKKGEELEGCLIAVMPQTGHVIALVGGRNYQVNQFNRATQARRQPGSIFKPVVYLTAFEQSLAPSKGKPPVTPATILDDSPLNLISDNKPWSPQNYDKLFHGNVTVRKALENSMNVPTVRLALQTGLDAVIESARKLGIESPLRPTPALALGSYEVIPMEMASAYTVLANGGTRVELQTIKGISGPDGKRLEGRELQVGAAFSPQASFLLTQMLKGVVEEGTGRKIREMGFKRAAAGKTGTTNDYKDAWFAGYTPDLLTLVWVGFDNAEKIDLTGAAAALPIWVDFMSLALEEFPENDFTLPQRIAVVRISPAGGLKWAPECGAEYIDEAFLEGTEPKEFCKPGEKK
ncbi:MAG TPA: PBP1A family penicillin-binding protein [Nitrospiria bacterium]|nr:PBP1A family penicillin-binding protein [Nitrospiria bacterium]